MSSNRFYLMPRIVSDSSYVEILRMTLNPVRIEPVFGTQNTFRNFYFATSQYSSLSRKCNDSLTSLFSRNIRTSSTFNFNIQRYIIKKNYRRNLWDLEFSFIYYKKKLIAQENSQFVEIKARSNTCKKNTLFPGIKF